VEGYEFPMLLGAENVILVNRPRISVAVYHRANHHLEMMDYLRDLHPDYQYRTRGIAANGNPIFLQVD
jgi:hypothetical protein